MIIFGADGLAAELAKNLTLVGIKSLHIIDDLTVFFCCFFLSFYILIVHLIFTFFDLLF